jgi:general secretion pathway protein C
MALATAWLRRAWANASSALGTEAWFSLLAPAKWLLILLLSYQLADLTLLLFGPEAAKVVAPVPRPGEATGPLLLTPQETQRLVAYDPFRGGSSNVASVPAPQTAVPASRLQVTLKGTVVGEGEDSYAILLVPEVGSRDDVYRLGQDLLPGVSLARIERDQVVVLNHGREETVALETPAVPGAPAERQPAALPVRTISKAMVEAQKQDPGALMRSVQLQPRDGGLQVSRLQRGSLLQQAGLSEGDVIVAINGRRVASLGELASVYPEVEGASNLEVQVLRNGEPVTLGVAIR